MFCKKCGQELNGEIKFCVNCGEVASPTIHASAPESKKKIKHWLVGIKEILKKINTKKSVQIIVVIIIIIAGIYGSRNDDAIKKNDDAIKNYDSGKSQEAMSQLEEAAKNATQDDTKIATLKNLAYVYSSENKNDLALDSFQQALKLTNNGSYDYFLVSGEIALLQDRPYDAYINYNKAYQLNPDDFQINNALNLFYIDLEGKHPEYQDYKKALSYALKAYELNKLDLVKQNLAVAQYFNENYDEAISLLSSVNLDKDSYTAYWLGLSYARKDDTANAKYYLQKAIDNGVQVPQEVINFLNSN